MSAKVKINPNSLERRMRKDDKYEGLRLIVGAQKSLRASLEEVHLLWKMLSFIYIKLYFSFPNC